MADVSDTILQDILDRLRRIETRYTKFMEFMGFDTQTKKPQWRNGVVRVPSANISLKDVLAVVPPEWPYAVSVTHWDGEHILEFYPRVKVR